MMKNRIYPSQPQIAVGAVVFKEDHILLVHRRNPPAQDVWAIPGGKVKLGETLQQAAEREILEETGIIIQATDPIFTFDMIDRDHSGRPRFHYVIIDLMATYLGGQLMSGDDAKAAMWVSEESMTTLTVSRVTRQLLHERFGFGSPPNRSSHPLPDPLSGQSPGSVSGPQGDTGRVSVPSRSSGRKV